jgi:hypothetical protein
MKLLAVAAPDSSGHYRIRQPIDELTRQGIEGFEVLPEGLPLIHSTSEGIVGVAVDCDIVVLQRPMLWFMPQVIDLLHKKGIRVVIDLDDDFHTAHTHNTAFMLNHPRTNPMQNWHHLTDCVRKADLVTVSTDQLAKRYGSHGRVTVIRNCVDDDLLDFPHRGNGHTVGWAGSVINHPTDLQATRGGVNMALLDHPSWMFFCIGGARYIEQVKQGLELTYEPLATEWKPLELHLMLISGLDIGIVPLADLVFNHAKSWLKGIEYAALGVPFVASNMPEYQLLQERFKLGVLAEPKAKSWRRRLGAIMDQTDMRAQYAEWSKSQVRQHLTISRNAWRWQEVWESLRSRASVA